MIASYETQRQAVATLSQQLQHANGAIRVVKEQAATGNPTVLAADLAQLSAVKARQTPTTTALCIEYLAEKLAKINTEQLRDQARAALDLYRTSVFPSYQTAISERARQVIAMSHSKPFLCRIWGNSDTATRCALHVVRDNTGSTIAAWNVSADSVTEYDRRHAELRDYTANGAGTPRLVAQTIRPVLEGYLRVACSEHFKPGTLLGQFRELARQRVGSNQEILNATDIQELQDLTEYANRFHHDTNSAWETEAINNGELLGFVKRALAFTRK